MLIAAAVGAAGGERGRGGSRPVGDERLARGTARAVRRACVRGVVDANGGAGQWSVAAGAYVGASEGACSSAASAVMTRSLS